MYLDIHSGFKCHLKNTAQRVLVSVIMTKALKVENSSSLKLPCLELVMITFWSVNMEPAVNESEHLIDRRIIKKSAIIR